MLLLRLLTATKTMLIDLILDLGRGVGHVYSGVSIARAHLRLRALEGREELGVDEEGFGVLEFGGDVPGEAEVRVLVDRAGDKARNVGFGAEDLREGV